MSKKYKAMLLPHTHWDREWRYPIWQNRSLLVRFMDELLELFENDPDYSCFLLDGQVIPVLDYLEIRPEKRAAIEECVASGRLIIGPWYTLPDLYPLDAECLVRNLQRGMRVSAQLGKCYRKVAYHSFGWGQCSQFPQIYRQLGFDMVITAKKVSKERAPNSEFLWRSPDGSEILTSRLGKYYRANAFFSVHIPLLHGIKFSDPNYRLNWGDSGQLVHWVSNGYSEQDYFRVDREQDYHIDKLREALQEAWDNMQDSLCPDIRLLMYGSDFSTPNHHITRIVKDANEMFDDIEFAVASPEQYADVLHDRLDLKQLPLVEGELRDGPANECSANALAVRMPIKILNKQAENLLIRGAEPLAVMVYALGGDYPVGMLRKAWSYMFAAHPHDSINGVGQDKSADDTSYRLQQAKEIAETLCLESAGKLAAMIDSSRYERKSQLVLLVNPRPYPAREIVQLQLDTPREQCVEAFALRDSEGQVLDVQQIARNEAKVPVNDFDARPWPFYIDRHKVFADTGEIPAGGYKVLEVVPTANFVRTKEWWPSQAVSDGRELSNEVRTLENEFLRVVAEANGTITLTDKEASRVYSGLLEFEDSGDSGDYWAHYKPQSNRTVYSAGGPAEIWLEENGPLSATLAIRIGLRVSAQADFPDSPRQIYGQRSEGEVELKIVSRLTLRRGSRSLRVRTEVDNCARDHRLRVLLPTDIETDFTDAAGHFCVDRRPIRPIHDDEGNSYPEMQTQPMHSFVDISDGEKGLAVVSSSFTEYQLIKDSHRTLALTLFRSVRNRICTEERCTGDFPSQKGGQLLKKMEFEYTIYPHSGNWNEGGVYTEAERLNAQVFAFQITPAGVGEGGPSASLFELESRDMVLSSIKKLEDRAGIAVRVFNPGPRAAKGFLRIESQVGKAYQINLNEERVRELEFNDGIELVLAAAEIVTVELES